jgi:hypothetical protein
MIQYFRDTCGGIDVLDTRWPVIGLAEGETRWRA